MAQHKPLTREEIQKKEALHNALTKWLNDQSIEHLDEYHRNTFGHDFDPNEKKEEAVNDTFSYDEEER